MEMQHLQVGPIGTNCYLLKDGDSGRCAVVDPGDEGARIAALCERQGLTPCAVFLTHGHWDHVGGVAALLERWPGLPVYLHAADRLGGGGDPHYQYDGQGAGQRTYDEGDEIPFGTERIRVLHTPGHSPGSVVLLWGDVMLAGDTLFAGSCGRCDLPGGDWEAMLDSLGRLSRLAGDYQVCPGHGPLSTLSAERRGNPYLRQAAAR